MILKNNKWRSWLLFIIFTGLFIGDNYFHKGKSYRTEKSLAMERTEPLLRLLGTLPEGTVISYEPEVLESPAIYYHLDAMLASQSCNLVSVNGYSANCPHDFGMFWDNINAESRNHWLSKSNRSFDSLALIKSVERYEYIHWGEVEEYTDPDEPSFEEKLELQIENIRSDKQWMKHVEEKAEENQISVDSMILLDAIWVLENETDD